MDKNYVTIVKQACDKVMGFEQLYKEMEQAVSALAQICSIAFVLRGICALKVHHTIKVFNSLIFKKSFYWHRYANATLPLLHICASEEFWSPRLILQMILYGPRMTDNVCI
jgi:hypothetical protein